MVLNPRWQAEVERLTDFKASFSNYVAAMRTCSVPRDQFLPFVEAVLALHPPEPLKPRTPEADDWASLSTHITVLCTRYAECPLRIGRPI